MLACVSGATAGFLLLCVPAAANNGLPGSFFSLTRLAIEELSVAVVFVLVVAAFGWGFALKRPYSVIAAVSQLAFFPIVAVVEMSKDSTSHNLWPVEFVLYGVLTAFCFGAVKLAGVWKRWLSDAN